MPAGSVAPPRPPTTPRVCLYGGAFDPPHLAHRGVVLACREQLGVDRLIVIPTGNHPFKGDRHHAPAAARLALCALAFSDLPWVEVSDCEIRRLGVGYTIDTLRAFRGELGDAAQLYFLIGSDNLRDLPKWREHHAALALAQFVTVPRSGSSDVARELAGLDLTAKERDGLCAHVLRVTPSPISSTEVRRRLRAGESVDDLLQPRVRDAIAQQKLYRAP